LQHSQTAAVFSLCLPPALTRRLSQPHRCAWRRRCAAQL